MMCGWLVSVVEHIRGLGFYIAHHILQIDNQHHPNSDSLSKHNVEFFQKRIVTLLL